MAGEDTFRRFLDERYSEWKVATGLAITARGMVLRGELPPAFEEELRRSLNEILGVPIFTVPSPGTSHIVE